MHGCTLDFILLCFFFTQCNSQTFDCSVVLTTDYTTTQMYGSSRSGLTFCNMCNCNNPGYGCQLGANKYYPTCVGYGNMCGVYPFTTVCVQACAPGSAISSWYCLGPTCTKSYPPSLGTGSNFWTYDSCLACAAGNYSSAGTSCSPCPTGSACAGTGMTTPTQCTGGTYTSTTGQPSCSECSSGTYSGAGASACTPCDIGYYSGAGAGSCSPCTNRPGNALAYTSSASSNSCGYSSTPSCPAGTYAEQSSSSCKPCTSGTYQGSTTTSWATGCVTCPAGSQCPSGGLTSATPCANGFFSNAGFTVCTIICAAGRFANFGQSVCSTCNAGTFS